jgi:hypothetical protein
LKQIFGYIKTFYKEEFKWSYGVFILVFAALLLYLNFFYTDTKTLHATLRWQNSSVLYYFSLYAGVFGLSALAQRLFYKQPDRAFLKDYRFWLIAAFGILVWSCRNSLIYYYTIYIGNDLPQLTVSDQTLFRCLFALLKFSLGFIPLFLFWWFRDRKAQPLYGMYKGSLNLRPYLIMLALMVPVIAIASQDAGFLRKYPRSQLIRAIELFNPDHAGYILSYETLYILDFYVIELFFRGFMILAFVKIAGPKVILPTAVFYCALHFGKPFGEALSSLFGGTLLGIITYYSRSIWGGIIVHMGIALVMEVCAYLTLAYLS